MLHTAETKIVIFDISCEYTFLLLDVLADPNMRAKVILEHRIDALEQFFNSVVKPREYETDERTKTGLQTIVAQGKVAFYTKPKQKIPTYSQMLDELDDQRKDAVGKPHYQNAVDAIHDAVREWVEKHGLSENQEVSEDFVGYIDGIAQDAVERFKVHDKSGLYAWATTRNTISDLFKKRGEKEAKDTSALTVESIRELLEDKTTNLIVISISDPFTITALAISLTQDLLVRRKRRFTVK